MTSMWGSFSELSGGFSWWDGRKSHLISIGSSSEIRMIVELEVHRFIRDGYRE